MEYGPDDMALLTDDDETTRPGDEDDWDDAFLSDN